MSYQAVEQAVKVCMDIDTGALMVMVNLARRCDEHGFNAFPSIKTLAADSRMGESTARQKISELERRGWITRVKQASQHKPPTWRLNLGLKGGAPLPESAVSRPPEPEALDHAPDLQKLEPSAVSDLQDSDSLNLEVQTSASRPPGSSIQTSRIGNAYKEEQSVNSPEQSSENAAAGQTDFSLTAAEPEKSTKPPAVKKKPVVWPEGLGWIPGFLDTQTMLDIPHDVIAEIAPAYTFYDPDYWRKLEQRCFGRGSITQEWLEREFAGIAFWQLNKPDRQPKGWRAFVGNWLFKSAKDLAKERQYGGSQQNGRFRGQPISAAKVGGGVGSHEATQKRLRELGLDTSTSTHK